jgi:myo-inositol-1(or 4)-monophosphatase
MTDDELAARFLFVSKLTREVGALAARHFANTGALRIEKKGPQDLVSEADRETEEPIRRRLNENSPAEAFLGEESCRPAHSHTGIWVVDPIDGTQPLVSGMPNWFICIAFVGGSTSEFGCIFDPISPELFSARRGFGATLNGKSIRCHPGRTIQDGVASAGCSMQAKPNAVLHILHQLIDNMGEFHHNWFAALSLCYVAGGRLLGFIEAHLNSWDCLAALVIISESGGKHNHFLQGGGL